MRTGKQLLVALFCFVLSSGAFALGASQQNAPLSRAEVKAETAIWNQSGLSDFPVDLYPPRPWDPGRAEAQKRYDELRNSPLFAELVQKYSQ